MGPKRFPSQQVFICYAREDAEAAERLAARLREAGVDAWLDQSSLRGGEPWEKRIKGAIDNCALFIPIISQNTVARSEGYFRFEWKLALTRMQRMADDVQFLHPVAIDDTPASGAARVPDEFLHRQWVRLPNGEPSPDFISQLREAIAWITGGESRAQRQVTSAPKDHGIPAAPANPVPAQIEDSLSCDTFAVADIDARINEIESELTRMGDDEPTWLNGAMSRNAQRNMRRGPLLAELESLRDERKRLRPHDPCP